MQDLLQAQQCILQPRQQRTTSWYYCFFENNICRFVSSFITQFLLYNNKQLAIELTRQKDSGNHILQNCILYNFYEKFKNGNEYKISQVLLKNEIRYSVCCVRCGSSYTKIEKPQFVFRTYSLMYVRNGSVLQLGTVVGKPNYSFTVLTQHEGVKRNNNFNNENWGC